MHRASRYRLYLQQAQQRQFTRLCGVARFTYTKLSAEQKPEYHDSRQTRGKSWRPPCSSSRGRSTSWRCRKTPNGGADYLIPWCAFQNISFRIGRVKEKRESTRMRKRCKSLTTYEQNPKTASAKLDLQHGTCL